MLCPYAVLSKNSRGRKVKEPFDPQRLPFQKDRDRIIHCRAFRRLKEKTQVFIPHYGDHYRNRLSHSLEVSQISRDLARTLGLNEDLTEAIALAHDLGHTPFGHAGEDALHECMQKYGLSFEHNEQSRKIVEELEEVYPNFRGLNLSLEVIEGLMKHQTSWDNPTGVEAIRPSLEAQVVNMGDEIAYQNHDVDDGLRSGLFTEKDLEKLVLWQWAKEGIAIADEKIRVARIVSKMISLMIWDIAEETSRLIQKHGIQNLQDVYACKEKLVGFSSAMVAANKELKEFLTTRLYFHPKVVRNSAHGKKIIKTLFAYYMKERDGLPETNVEAATEVKDYLAGMTDRFAELQAREFEGL
ncbi:MAG: deoxyguanosinetriphosphate triphosphohydrolase [Candidatus Gracilibacteria bacterium]